MKISDQLKGIVVVTMLGLKKMAAVLTIIY